MPSKATDESNEKSLRFRSIYGCPDLGTRLYKFLQGKGITQATMADELRLSTGQVSKVLNDKVDLTVGAFLHFMHRLNERPSAFLGERNAPTAELLQLLRKLVQVATPFVEAPGSRTISEETRLVPLLRVAATPDNETYDDDPEPRLYALPQEYNKSETAAFEVIGDSMSGDSILSGDVIFTRPPRDLNECQGEIVVCLVSGYRHLKRFRRRRGRIVLESTAPARRLWELDQSERTTFRALGIVIGQTRRIAR